MKRSLSNNVGIEIKITLSTFMNKFEFTFFEKYVPEWQEIKWILHVHFINIFKKLLLWMSLWAIIPSFLFYYSVRLQELLPFFILETLLIIIFLKVIYLIFDWYNDVWIVTNAWVIQLERKLFKTDSKTVEFDKIEWIEVQQWTFMDKLLKKWDLLIHKVWDDTFLLPNAINPYAWVDFIEEISQENEEIIETNSEHYDLIMDAFWWVVEKYLEKKSRVSEKRRQIEKIIEEVEQTKWTIDLR